MSSNVFRRVLALPIMVFFLTISSSAFAMTKKEVCAQSTVPSGWAVISEKNLGPIHCSFTYNWIIADLTTARPGEGVVICGLYDRCAVAGWKFVQKTHSMNCVDRGENNATSFVFEKPISTASTDSCKKTKWYRDADRDGYGDPYDSVSECNKPNGYVSNKSDKCDDNPYTLTPLEYYRDYDGDGYGNPEESVTRCKKPTGYVSNDSDQCDNNPKILKPQEYYKDSDGDGYGNPKERISACNPPSGYVDNFDDQCDDNRNTKDPMVFFRDNDGDGYGGNYAVHSCYEQKGYSLSKNKDDLNDYNNLIHSKSKNNLLIYRKTGTAAGYNLNSNGTLSNKDRIFISFSADNSNSAGITFPFGGLSTIYKSNYQWKENFDKIISYQQDFRSFFMLYKNDGHVSIVEMKDDGTVKEEVYSSSSWTKDWHVIEPFTMQMQTYILFYKKDGYASIFKMNSDGKLGENVFSTTDWIEWSNIKFYLSEDHYPHLFFYRKDGLVNIFTINPSNMNLNLKWVKIGWTKNLTNIVPIKTPEGSYILFYRANDETATIYNMQKGMGFVEIYNSAKTTNNDDTDDSNDFSAHGDRLATYITPEGHVYLISSRIDGEISLNNVDVWQDGVEFSETSYNHDMFLDELAIY